MRSPDQPVRIGMLGCGVVGSEVARLILADSAELSTRAGAKIELVKIAVREIKQRSGIPQELFTLDAESIVNDPSIDLIIENGSHSNRDFISTFESGFLITWASAILKGDKTFVYDGKSYKTQGGTALK